MNGPVPTGFRPNRSLYICTASTGTIAVGSMVSAYRNNGFSCVSLIVNVYLSILCRPATSVFDRSADAPALAVAARYASRPTTAPSIAKKLCVLMLASAKRRNEYSTSSTVSSRPLPPAKQALSMKRTPLRSLNV